MLHFWVEVKWCGSDANVCHSKLTIMTGLSCESRHLPLVLPIVNQVDGIAQIKTSHKRTFGLVAYLLWSEIDLSSI